MYAASSALYGDSRFGATARFYAKQMKVLEQPSYLYFFTRVPPSPHQTVGAFHAVEIAFIFDKSVPLFPTSEQDLLIRHAMGNYWVQFAKTGNPNMGALPKWSVFSEADQRHMVFGPEIGVTSMERAVAYDVFERYLLQLIETVAGEG